MHSPSPTAPPQSEEWAPIVKEIQAGNPEGFVLLYRRLKSYRGYFINQVGWQNTEDLYHELILELVAQIRRGVLRDPERLPAYARTIAQRKVIPIVRSNLKRRACEIPVEDVRWDLGGPPGPEAQVILRQQEEIAGRILRSLRERDREVLIRFYLREQAPERIQADLDLSETQFRLIKSRAKARFAALCQERLERKRPGRAWTSWEESRESTERARHKAVS
jgi:RNA polymerase sigma-70 factor, ECF subfamily